MQVGHLKKRLPLNNVMGFTASQDDHLILRLCRPTALHDLYGGKHAISAGQLLNISHYTSIMLVVTCVECWHPAVTLDAM